MLSIKTAGCWRFSGRNHARRGTTQRNHRWVKITYAEEVPKIVDRRAPPLGLKGVVCPRQLVFCCSALSAPPDDHNRKDY